MARGGLADENWLGSWKPDALVNRRPVADNMAHLYDDLTLQPRSVRQPFDSCEVASRHCCSHGETDPRRTGRCHKACLAPGQACYHGARLFMEIVDFHK